MADIDKIKASNGTEYNLKDSVARDSISRYPNLALLVASSNQTEYQLTVPARTAGTSATLYRNMLVMSAYGMWQIRYSDSNNTSALLNTFWESSGYTPTIGYNCPTMTLSFGKTVYGGLRCIVMD